MIDECKEGVNGNAPGNPYAGLKIFVIDSNGSDVAKVLNQTAQAGRIYAKTSLEENLKTALIGASRRLPRKIFGNAEIERAKGDEVF